MPILLVFAVVFVIFLVRIVVQLFTDPASTIPKLGSWAFSFLGFMSLVGAGALAFAVFSHEGKPDAEMTFFMVVTALAAVLFFIVASWMKRVRRRAELRREYRLHDQAARQVEQNSLRRFR